MEHKIDFPNLPDCALVRVRQLAPVVGVSAMSIWRYVKDDKFPKPIKVSANVTAWRWGDVRAWLDARASGAQQ